MSGERPTELEEGWYFATPIHHTRDYREVVRAFRDNFGQMLVKSPAGVNLIPQMWYVDFVKAIDPLSEARDETK